MKYTVSVASSGETVLVSGGGSAGNAGPETHTIDEGTLPPGLEAALKRMKKGELAKVTMAAHHTACASWENVVPRDVSLVVEVELLHIQAFKDTWDMSVEEKLTTADKLREMGNDLFKKGQLARAARRYQKSLSCVESDYNFSEEQKTQAKEKKVLANLNLAAVELKQGQYRLACESSGKALALDADNVKGLFRRGTALLELGEWDDARKDLRRALEIEPSNASARSALATLHERVTKQRESDKQRYRGMFERLSKMEAKERAEATPATAAGSEGGEAAPMQS